MGVFRLWLAVAVIAAHTDVRLGISGRAAVTIFYFISGYLITLVLNDVYRTHSGAFYFNRALRILVPAVFVATLAHLSYLAANVKIPFLSAPEGFVLLSAIANFLVIPQDLAWFFAVSTDGTVVWQPVGRQGTSVPFADFQYNRPLFTIAIELYFYLLAPFVVRSFKRVLVFTSIGFLWHAGCQLVGCYSPELNYHCFIASWFFFGSGALCFWMHQPIGERWLSLSELRTDPRLQRVRQCVVIFSIFSIGLIWFRAFGWPFGYIACWVLLPKLLAYSRRHKIDDYFGKYSYLIYLVHWPILVLLREKLPIALSEWSLFFVLLPLSLVVAAFVHHGVEGPLDRLRDKIRSGKVVLRRRRPSSAGDLGPSVLVTR
jgi:peptidoglycan/LPS O-acetylase OafA/YrhL